VKVSVDDLRRLRLFEDAQEDDLRQIAELIVRREYPEQTVIFWEGSEGRELFFVERGEVIISRRLRGRVEHVLARLGPGTFFGEVALLTDGVHRATAQTAEPTSVLVIDGTAVLRIIEDTPQAAARFFLHLARELSLRLVDANDKIREAVMWGLDATHFQEMEQEQ